MVETKKKPFEKIARASYTKTDANESNAMNGRGELLVVLVCVLSTLLLWLVRGGGGVDVTAAAATAADASGSSCSGFGTVVAPVEAELVFVCGFCPY